LVSTAINRLQRFAVWVGVNSKGRWPDIAVVPGGPWRARGIGQRRTRTVLQAASVGEGDVLRVLGVFLDTLGENNVSWEEIAAILTEAYRYVAPMKLIADLEGSPGLRHLE
jgi:hypothetical protein